MPLPLWLASIRRRLAPSSSRPRGQAQRPRYRPGVEALEGRWVPAAFLVTTAADAGAGSLRQAILDANATPGTNEIDFAIGDGGPQTIRPSSDLPEATHSVIIDGTTQPGFAGSPLIDLDGTDGYDGMNGLIIHANDCTVRGLAITNFSFGFNDPCTVMYGVVLWGNGNVVEGNYLGTDVTGTLRMGNSVGVFVLSGSNNNRIGGTTAAQRNLISGNDAGVWLGGSNNVVLGNYIGTDVTGTAPLGNGYGLQIGGSDNLIGGTTAEARNLISGNLYSGIKFDGITGNGPHNIRVQGNYIGTDLTGTQALGNEEGVTIMNGVNNLIGGTEAGAGNLISGNKFNGVQALSNQGSNLIQGNRIGTDVTGTQALGNGLRGVYVWGSPNNLIGGTEAGAGNLISGNAWEGIYLGTYSANGSNLVQGNYIGTDVTGAQALGNGHDGVHINIDNNDTIGGEAPGAANTIAFNGGDGVLVDRGTGNALLGNAIFANGNLGIELLHGANHDQAPPVLTSVTSDGTSTTVSGTLTSTPNTIFTLEFFASDPTDPSGRQQFLGSVVVTTDADGNASFTATLATAVAPGSFLTATATDPANNTSQFSAGVPVTG
jgi:hypothetical protein